ncbi:unnamed protein product (macronuclear) [Paramecium tetraurelia]|uniref:Uncharacterized protein n=1 Tax=Paramecium tetraurelia TaxID=5888 RepID=A0C5T3_PARTE|nr:uncharacterized protein GSPATT00035279001 [Paramecium tetraurelia]CAK66150.1 unnamed protein product [Paramecium tetraurelia]|eukprot:XP_001433547.1 hypothetical protein (macronuclear) [Paramecium tetraurelia strain d4-2]
MNLRCSAFRYFRFNHTNNKEQEFDIFYMLNQVLQVIGVQQNEEQQMEAIYDDFQRPPKIKIAMMHAAATKFAKTDPNIDLDKTNVCPCCGLPAIIEEIPLCSSRNEFSFNGSGIALYFDFLVFSGVIVFAYIAISCGYDIYANYQGQRCSQIKSSIADKCKTDFFNQFSLTNDHEELDEARSILNFISQVVILFLTLFYRRHISKIAMELDDAAILASDFSIIVENIPRDAKEPEIQEYFSQPFQNETVEFRKLCIAYEIQPYLKLNKQKQLKETVLTKVLELEAEGKQIPKSIPPRVQLVQEIDKISKELDYMEDHRATIFDFSGICIITYNYEKQADNVCKTFKSTRFQILLDQLGFEQNEFKKFRNNNLFVRKAPEPGDIIWGNLGITIKEQYKRTLITNAMTLFLLAIGFGLLVGLSYAQNIINKHISKGSAAEAAIITLLGFASSILISIINVVLAKMIIKFAELEQQATRTDYNVSVAYKMGVAQFLNTAILTLIINLFIQEDIVSLDQAIWQTGGLNSDVMLIFITNSIMPWLTLLLDVNYFYKLYVRRKIIKQGENCKYTQNEANQAFEGPTIDLSQKYAKLCKTLLFTFLYAALLPLGVCFTFLSIVCIYWTEKYLLIRRDSKPAPTGSAMAEAMIDFYIELILLLFSLGCTFWEWVNYDKVHILTWLQLGLSTLHYFIPISKICGCIVDLGIDNATLESYDEKFLTFYDDYDRRNPVTLDAAKEKWIKIQQETVQPTPQPKTATQLKQYHQIQHITTGSTKIHPLNSRNSREIDDLQQLQV